MHNKMFSKFLKLPKITNKILFIQQILKKSKSYHWYLFKISDKNYAFISERICNELYFDLIKILGISNFFECGAHDAWASRLLSKTGINCVAIEANPITFKYLTSKDSKNFTTINIGLGKDKKNFKNLFVPIGRNTSGSTTFSPKKDETYKQYNIPTTSLDNIFSKQKFKLPGIALWIDVEGLQQEVLEGAGAVLSHPECTLIKIELELEDVFNNNFLLQDANIILESFGFRCVACDLMSKTQSNCIYVKSSCINDIEEIMEIFFSKLQNHELSFRLKLFFIFQPLFSLIKKILSKIFGKALTNKIGIMLGSKESERIHNDL